MISLFNLAQEQAVANTSDRRETDLIEQRLHGHHTKFQMGQQISLSQLLEDYKSTFKAQTLLFQYLGCSEAFYIRAEQLRHPLIFYYGHTMTMYINKFLEGGLQQKRLNERFETMFAIGVDQMDWDDLNQSHYNWPTIQQVKEYRQRANQIIIKAIQNLQNKKVSINGSVWDILMCIEHHKIHIETSAAIIRKVPIQMISNVPEFKECPSRESSHAKTPKNSMVSVNPYRFEWKFNKNNANMYLFDNEMGKAQSDVKGFQISKYQVSNGEFFQFIQDGGYLNNAFWTQEGKAWLKSKKRRHPIYWKINMENQESDLTNPDKYKLRIMGNVIEMPWNWPAEVNQLQAQAFCNWKSSKDGKKYQLPTQEEFFATRDQNISNIYEKQHLEGNFDRNNWFSPCPVDFFKAGQIYNIIGNVWQHTRTPFHAFSGFKVQNNFEDYSAPYFGQKHGMLFGGSFASGKKDAIVTRNWFRHHFYNFIGFRYTVSQNEVNKYTTEKEENFFEYDDQISESIKTNYFDSSSYIEKALNILRANQYFTGINQKEKVLIAGVNVGRIALELSKDFKEVIGIDYSARYFKIAVNFLCKGVIYQNLDTKISLEQLNLANKDNIHFMISNPENPDMNKLTEYNLIFVDGRGLRSKRLIESLKVLKTIKSKVMKTKVVVISSESNENSINDKNFHEIVDKKNSLIFKASIQQEKGLELFAFQL